MSITRNNCIASVKNSNTLDLTGQAINEDSLVNHIAPFLKENPQIKHVNLFACFAKKSITFSGLKALLDVKSIESLNLSSNIISPESAKAFCFAEVSKLNINYCHFTDDMLNSLRKNTHLIKLKMDSLTTNERKLSHIGISTLSTLPNLKSLDISSSLPGEEGCELLAQMALETLHMNGCQIDAKMISKFQNNNTLVKLALHENPIGDDGMAVIPTMKKLKKLIASSTKLTDLAMAHLASSHSLVDILITAQDEKFLFTLQKQHTKAISLPRSAMTSIFIQRILSQTEHHENSLAETTYVNQISDNGHRILASNSNLKGYIDRFVEDFSNGHVNKHKGLKASPIKNLNFGRKNGAKPPIPSLKDMSMFAWREAINKNPALKSGESVDAFVTGYPELVNEYLRLRRIP